MLNVFTFLKEFNMLNRPYSKTWKIKSKDGSIRRNAVSLPPHHYGSVYFNDDGISVFVDDLTARACVETGLFDFEESPGDIHKTLIANEEPIEEKSKVEVKEEPKVSTAQHKAQAATKSK